MQKTEIVKPTDTTIEVVSGDAVFELLEDRKFTEGWDDLYQNSPLATIFQSRTFVETWYYFYGSMFLPVIVKAEFAGRLTGLLTLARDQKNLITGAGANQAEYQLWLTADAKDETFIQAALLELRRHFSGSNIRFRYVPTSIPLNWIEEGREWNKRCFVIISEQPLMTINDEYFANELRKKNRREKINRMNRMGTLHMERIKNYNEFPLVFDELAVQSDFRKGARYNRITFKNDPVRKNFLLALFEQQALHVTVLKLDDTIIASNVSTCTNNQLYMQGLNAHSPAFSKYSPGIIHFLLLGRLLAEEGVQVFDLTPGEDPYKEMLATDRRPVYTLSFGNGRYGYIKRLITGIGNWLKKIIYRMYPQPDKLKRKFIVYREQFRNAGGGALQAIFAWLFSSMKSPGKTNHYRFSLNTSILYSGGIVNVRKDCLKDLLNLDPGRDLFSRWKFLSDAMRRFEEGQHCFSRAGKGGLLACAWLMNGQATAENRDKTVALSGLYCHPTYRKKFPLFLKSVAAELVADVADDQFYIDADCNNYRVFEDAGFRKV